MQYHGKHLKTKTFIIPTTVYWALFFRLITEHNTQIIRTSNFNNEPINFSIAKICNEPEQNSFVAGILSVHVMTHIELLWEKSAIACVKIEFVMHCTHSCSLALSSSVIRHFFSLNKRFIFLVHCLVVIAKWKWLPFFMRLSLTAVVIAAASILIYEANVAVTRRA